MEPQSHADLNAEMPALCSLAIDMLRHTKKAFQGQQPDSLDMADRLGRLLHDSEKSLTQRIVHRLGGRQFVLQADQQRLFVPMHIERVGDHIELLIRALRTMMREGTQFTDRARREVDELVNEAIVLLVDLRDLLLTGNEALRRHIVDRGRLLVARADDGAAFHQQRLIEGVCMPKASSVYLAMLDAIKGVEWHAREIAQKLEHPTAADLRDVANAFEVSGASPRQEIGGPGGANEESPLPKVVPVGWVP
jgi:Na+/phosphate symporter